jgi:hypothetical protein
VLTGFLCLVVFVSSFALRKYSSLLIRSSSKVPVLVPVAQYSGVTPRYGGCTTGISGQVLQYPTW